MDGSGGNALCSSVPRLRKTRSAGFFQRFTPVVPRFSVTLHAMNTRIYYCLAASLMRTAMLPGQAGAADPTYDLIDPHSYALAINQAGQVAGYGRTARGAQAFVYRDRRVQEFGLRSGTNSYATSINLLGHVAGFADQAEGVRAFIFQDGALSQLSPLNDVDHYAFGINDSGWVVGHVARPNGDEAFVFDGSIAIALGSLGGSNSYAYAINARGAVAAVPWPRSSPASTPRSGMWDNFLISTTFSIRARAGTWRKHARLTTKA
jgi:probable HAF family extracellular repeat protein